MSKQLKLTNDFLDAGVTFLKALAHRDRLRIISCLLDNECCVSELDQLLTLHQPSLSQHLTVLRKAGLVGTRRCSKRIYYHLQNENITQILDELRKLHQPGNVETKKNGT